MMMFHHNNLSVSFLFTVCSLILWQVECIKFKNCECGLMKNEVNRIAGGWSVKPHSFPWVVGINNDGKLYCGGTIINDRYILTAGHCVQWTNENRLSIVIGQHNRRLRDGVSIDVKEIILHEGFYSHQHYDETDIALIKLHKPLTYNNKVQSVCLPHFNTNHFGQYATIIGWGRLGQDQRVANVLQQTLVRILYPEECLNTTMRRFVTDEVLCAYYDRRDACQGDSGGPMVLEREPGKAEQVGIVSWGLGCASPNAPGIYTKVEKFLSWIYYHTQDAYYCMN